MLYRIAKLDEESQNAVQYIGRHVLKLKDNNAELYAFNEIEDFFLEATLRRFMNIWSANSANDSSSKRSRQEVFKEVLSDVLRGQFDDNE